MTTTIAVITCEHDTQGNDEPINCITNRGALEGEPVRLRTCHDCDQRLYERNEPITLLDGRVISVNVTQHRVSDLIPAQRQETA